jgi:hypothetical protein
MTGPWLLIITLVRSTFVNRPAERKQLGVRSATDHG